MPSDLFYPSCSAAETLTTPDRGGAGAEWCIQKVVIYPEEGENSELR